MYAVRSPLYGNTWFAKYKKEQILQYVAEQRCVFEEIKYCIVTKKLPSLVLQAYFKLRMNLCWLNLSNIR